MLLSAAAKVGHEALNGLDVTIESVDGAVRVTLTGEIAGEAVRYETVATLPETATRNPEVERLWAFQAIETRMARMELLGPDAEIETAVVDLTVENGILTPLTAMIAMRDERFAELGIARRNRDRVATKAQAAAQRASAPVRSARMDAARPMFTAPAPSHASARGGGGGSGSVGVIGMIVAGLVGLAATLGGGGRAGRRT